MAGYSTSSAAHKLDVSSLEADMAFFEARLSLAGQSPSTVYQIAQIKTYQTLGKLVGETLKSVKPVRSKSAKTAQND